MNSTDALHRILSTAPSWTVGRDPIPTTPSCPIGRAVARLGGLPRFVLSSSCSGSRRRGPSRIRRRPLNTKALGLLLGAVTRAAPRPRHHAAAHHRESWWPRSRAARRRRVGPRGGAIPSRGNRAPSGLRPGLRTRWSLDGEMARPRLRRDDPTTRARALGLGAARFLASGPHHAGGAGERGALLHAGRRDARDQRLRAGRAASSFARRRWVATRIFRPSQGASCASCSRAAAGRVLALLRRRAARGWTRSTRATSSSRSSVPATWAIPFRTAP